MRFIKSLALFKIVICASLLDKFGTGNSEQNELPSYDIDDMVSFPS